jgi:hypothetical protein
VWTAPLLASCLFVLSAFFLTAALLLAAARLFLLVALRAITGCAIVLRVASRRLLATTSAAGYILTALLHTLISFSDVCHINPPLFFSLMRIFRAVRRRPKHIRFLINLYAKKKISTIANVDAASDSINEHSNNTVSIKAEQPAKASTDFADYTD